MTATLPAYRLAQGYRVLGVQLADATAAAALAAHDRLGSRAFAAAGAALIARAQVRAVDLSAAFLADLLTLELRRPTAAPALDPGAYADPDHLGRALRTAAGDPASVARVARSEPLWAARTSLRDGMTASGQIDGWRRLTGARVCPFCAALADGSVLPPWVDVRTHPHCSCVALPVVRGVPDRHRPPTGDALEVVDT